MTAAETFLAPFLAPAGRLNWFRLGCLLLALFLAADPTSLARWSFVSVSSLSPARQASEELQEDECKLVVSPSGDRRPPPRAGFRNPQDDRDRTLTRQTCSLTLSRAPDLSRPAVPAGLTLPQRC